MSKLESVQISVRRAGRWILEDATLSFSAGELRAIVGPNGSGKSSLLRALAGLWPVAKGDVLLNGEPIARMPRGAVARRISYVPQEQRIDFAFTVREIVAMGRHPHRGRFAPESTRDVNAVNLALERCDIAHLPHRTVNTLSGGEYQRVLIARSLAVEPDFILLDEPTANLDVEHSIAVMELCRALTRDGRAVVLATHDLNAVARYATGVVLVQAGRLVECGVCEQVLSPRNVENVFHVRAELLSTRDGQPAYVFHGRSDASLESPRSKPICISNE